MPNVSVVIPTYNRAEFLDRAIKSVLAQTFQDFEIVIVNDASTDSGQTDKVVESFGDDRIIYVRHETNKGIGVARNTGVINSSGKYIAFLDDDDAWLSQKLEMQYKLLDSSPADVGVVYTGGYTFDWRSKKITKQKPPRYRGSILDALREKNCIGTSSRVMVRKVCFKRVGLFDEALVFGEDFDMWVRLAHEFKFDFIEDPLIFYTRHDIKLSTNYAKRLSGAERIFEKHREYFSTDRHRYSRLHFKLGLLYFYNCEMAKGRRSLIAAIKLSPCQTKYYYYLVVSLLGAQGLKQCIRITNYIRNAFSATAPDLTSVVEI